MIKNILSIFGTRLLVSVGNMVFFLALARAMGPELQGVVSYQLMLVGLLVLGGSLGLDAAAVYYLNRMGVSARAYLVRIAPVLIFSIMGSAGLVGLLYRQGLLGVEGMRTSLLLGFSLLIFPMELMISLIRSLWIARERIREYNTIEVIQSLVLYLLVGLVLVFRPESPALVLSMYLLDRTVVVLLLTRRLRAQPLDTATTPAGPAPRLREILRYSVFPWMSNVFAMLNIRLDTLMVAWFVLRVPTVRPADLGLYTICMIAVGRLQDVQMAIQVAFYPRVASLERTEAATLAARFYRITSPVYILLLLVMVVAGWPVLWMFGADYVRAYPSLIVLTFGIMALRANSGVLSMYFSAQGRPHVPTLVNGAGVVANVFLNLLLIPRYGILGAALGTAGAAGLTKGLLVLAFLHEGAGYRRDLWLKASDLREAWLVMRQQVTTHRLNPWRKTEDA